MNYINARLNWEDVFFQEVLDLEEKMISLDPSFINKSRLRLSLEKNILDWKKYQSWMTGATNVKALSEGLSQNQLSSLADLAATTLTTQNHHTIWNEDLIPLTMWDDHLIVLGLSQNENLATVKNCIFILADPKTLSFLSEKLFPNSNENAELSESAESADHLEVEEKSLLTGLDFKQEKIEINFKSASLLNPAIKQNLSSSAKVEPGSEALWEYLSERHDEYCFEAKKKFDAYVVLKIVDSKTSIYKMDSEIQKGLSNSKIFEQSVLEENPFAKVFKSGQSESFNINQLGESFHGYNYICITALKRGPTVIGFLLGLKSKRLAAEDELLLQDLAKESA